ncbi:iron-containing alcohol dehydrogenase [uncultured Roseobacter sp.]|uniref:iron-containing alcohol dehydrogenase n=1 Tax=uncultured Roseobacter sp. TaxID=114847 RepID=UPI0026355200|nr:iron-containing alcohol dehydrogenase [uncultured Roseobacter sp.]
MTDFSFLTAGRIVFGRGVAEQAIPRALQFGHRVLLVRGRSVVWVDHVTERLVAQGADVVPIFSSGEPDLPALETALATGRAAACDVVIAVGGGAVIDLGKALAALLPGEGSVLDHLEGVGHAKPLTAAPLPFIAVPTTAGTGAEVTKNAVITVPDAGRKVSLRDDRMLPDLALIDPALTDHAPRAQTLASGLDALTQVIEPYLSRRANPLTDALCTAAIPQGAAALARLAAQEDRAARDAMAFVSLSGGLTLANAGLGAVHGLAGVLGGRLGAPHGLICGRLLGPVMVANRAALSHLGMEVSRFDAVARWMAEGMEHDPNRLFHDWSALLDGWQVPGLSDWVASDVCLESIAEEAATSSSMKGNPCALSTATLVEVLQAAL